MKTVDIVQGTDEWLTWRKQGITATEASVLLGLNEHKTEWQIWAEKLGKVAPEDLSANPHVRRGKELEPEARDTVEEKYGKVLLPVCGENEENPYLRASFDGVDSDGIPWELKCPCETVWNSILENRRKSPEFKRYYPQVQHQILVTGADKGYLIFYYKGETAAFEIDRDEVMIQDILNKAPEFWEKVQNKTEPKKDPLRDIFVPVGIERGEWLTLASERKRIASFLTEAEKQVQTLKTQMKENEGKLVGLMGEFTHAKCDGVSVTLFSKQGGVDYKALLAAEAPGVELTDDVLNKYRKESSFQVRTSLTDTEDAESEASTKRSQQKAKNTDPAPSGEEYCSVYAF